ncbi:MAG: hypothetical protein JSV17_16565 [Candidatus Aminicenantes bacterium]|nr:MAG: hypothetical protein JSV17_16565 [Candidatus Aminicenantes bacterium]
MKKIFKLHVLCVISTLTLALFTCYAAPFSQEKTETEKLYAEIAGDYEFEFEGQAETITFFIQEGVLMGRDSDDDKGTQLEPAEGKELGFEVTTEEGQFIEITFSRDENGKITQCLLVTMGMEIQGVKISK